MASMTFRELNDQVMRFYADGKYVAALQLVEQNTDRFPEQVAHTVFWRLCFLSLCQRPDDCLAALQQALDSGLWWGDDLFLDPDLNNVRELPEFKRLVAVSQAKFEEACKHIKRDWVVLLPETPMPASGKYPLLIVLHGHSGNKESHLESWEVARQKGWVVLSVQSTQPLFPGAYRWNDAQQGLADLLYYFEDGLRDYAIDRDRIVIAGFSQGSGMSICAAMSGQLPVRGFIGVATYWADPGTLTPQRESAKGMRGYFVTGEKDHTLAMAKEIQKVLKENGIQFAEETHPELRHEFPAGFARSFEKAIDFIFMEQE